jgi:hypothetical protein
MGFSLKKYSRVGVSGSQTRDYVGAVDILRTREPEKQKQIPATAGRPHPAKIAGIPFGYAQGQRDDKWASRSQ